MQIKTSKLLFFKRILVCFSQSGLQIVEVECLQFSNDFFFLFQLICASYNFLAYKLNEDKTACCLTYYNKDQIGELRNATLQSVVEHLLQNVEVQSK